MTIAATSAQAEPVVVAALGDSLTAGYGLDTADGLVPQLQRWLDAQGAEVTVINAGLSGDTTAGGLARVDWTLTDDVDGMIVALGANDYLRGLPPTLVRDNLDGILAAAKAKGVATLLVGLDVGANYGADYKAEFDAIYPDLSKTHDVPLVPSFFAALIEEAGQEGLLGYLQGDGLHPTAEGVAVIVAALGPAVLDFAEGIE
ncbi:arylesterase [Yoonia sp. R2331]|uniref:arylesterase n=1 Tax=Yoonia sp. R2331 TaxID=3237238 RepID=UPI0034E4E333